MGQYIQNSLISGETIEKEATKISVFFIFCRFCLAITIGLVIFWQLAPPPPPPAMLLGRPVVVFQDTRPLTMFLFCVAFFVWFVVVAIGIMRTELALTNKKIIGKTGILNRAVDLPLGKLESITVNQGFIERMFDYGTVSVRSGGGDVVRFSGIKAPLEFRRVVMNLVEQNQTAQKH